MVSLSREFRCLLVAVTEDKFPLQARFIAQIIVLGGQVIGRAFAKALRQEFQSE